MAADWLLVQAEVLRVSDLEQVEATEVRTLLVGPRHTFGQVADAVNLAFTRWGLGCDVRFRLSEDGCDGRPRANAESCVADTVPEGDSFTLVFEGARRLVHRCRVVAANVDVRKELGFTPRRPIAQEVLGPRSGWGDRTRRGREHSGL
jgi:hypothetical protein